MRKSYYPVAKVIDNNGRVSGMLLDSCDKQESSVNYYPMDEFNELVQADVVQLFTWVSGKALHIIGVDDGFYHFNTPTLSHDEYMEQIIQFKLDAIASENTLSVCFFYAAETADVLHYSFYLHHPQPFTVDERDIIGQNAFRVERMAANLMRVECTLKDFVNNCTSLCTAYHYTFSFSGFPGANTKAPMYKFPQPSYTRHANGEELSAIIRQMVYLDRLGAQWVKSTTQSSGSEPAVSTMGSEPAVSTMGSEPAVSTMGSEPAVSRLSLGDATPDMVTNVWVIQFSDGSYFSGRTPMGEVQSTSHLRRAVFLGEDDLGAAREFIQKEGGTLCAFELRRRNV